MALFQRTKPLFAEEPHEAHATQFSGPRSAGDILRQRREALGLDLADVAAAIRIKPVYLAALEAGRPDQLPGPTYASGFVRTYGDQLGLDGKELLRRFRQEAPVLGAKPDLSFPMPLGERSVPGVPTLIVALILALCGYGAWYYVSTAQHSRLERVTEVPAMLLPPKTEHNPMEADLSHSAAAVAGSGVTATADKSPATSAMAGPQPIPVATAAAAAIRPPISAPAPPPAAAAIAQPATPAAGIPSAPPPPAGSEELRPATATAGSTRIAIRANADSWVQIRDASRTVILSRVLKAGETYNVPNEAGAEMRTGNAGGLEITVDGKAAPPIGRMGAIRNVALDPAALIAGSAIRN
jgi:cytoskeleton protein RodZ